MEFLEIQSPSRSFVQQCEEIFFSELTRTADTLAEQKELRIVTLTGPTCSGKTTAASLLVRRLFELGRRAHIVSVDDFYYDTAYLNRLSVDKGLSHIDYDSVDTIDLDALSAFVSEISDSAVIHAPIFDFRLGKRTGHRPLDIQKDDVVLFEGIQTGYPEVKRLFADQVYASVCIMPMRAIRSSRHVFWPNDLRLLRRIVRDFRFRNTSAERTMAMWQGVRRNEEEHIFPYLEDCEHRLDSTMPYELSILRPFLEEALSSITEHSPYRPWADEILEAMADVEAIPVSWLCEDSLYREFV